jgi:hypothetical protein
MFPTNQVITQLTNMRRLLEKVDAKHLLSDSYSMFQDVQKESATALDV